MAAFKNKDNGTWYVQFRYNEMVTRLKEIAKTPAYIDTMQNEDDQKLFVETFRELTKYLQSLQTFIEFSFDQDSLIMNEQEYQDYKSKYLMLYAKQKKDREVVSVLNDVDFCIELMESDRINVAYIMNLIRNIHFDDAKQKDYDIKHIKEELGRTDNPQLLRKVEILQAFLDRVVVGLESADEIDAAYNDFENEANVSSSNGLEKRPKLRFPGFDEPWEENELSHYLVENTERNRGLAFGKEDVLSVSGEYGVINQIAFQGRSFAGESVADYHVVETDDIVYTKSPLKANPYGIIKANKGIPGIVSTLYAVYHPLNTVAPRFVDLYFANDLRLNKFLKGMTL